MAASDRPAPLIEQSAGALDAQHAKEVLHVFAGIHVAAQGIACREQQAFQSGDPGYEGPQTQASSG